MGTILLLATQIDLEAVRHCIDGVGVGDSQAGAQRYFNHSTEANDGV